MLLFASVCWGNCSCQLSSASSYPHKAGLPGSFSQGRWRAATHPGEAPSIQGAAPAPGLASSPPGWGRAAWPHLGQPLDNGHGASAALLHSPKQGCHPGQAPKSRPVTGGPSFKSLPIGLDGDSTKARCPWSAVQAWTLPVSCSRVNLSLLWPDCCLSLAVPACSHNHKCCQQQGARTVSSMLSG